MTPNNHILLTIDVEDWFQVENFKQYIPYSSWDSYELRVEKNTHKLLDLLDSITLGRTEDRGQRTEDRNQRTEVSNKEPVEDPGKARNLSRLPCREELSYRGEIYSSNSGAYFTGTRNRQPASRNSQPLPSIALAQARQAGATRNGRRIMDNGRGETPHATFFVLGWIAERLPDLVREIHAHGHEVASHGYYHNLCNEQSTADLKRDLCDSKKLLEDIIGAPVYGYRAPSFSIGNDILEIIEKCGYLYDSSFNSFGVHGRYGHMDLSQNDNKGIVIKISNNFYELPVSNLTLNNHILRPLQNVQFCSRSRKTKISTGGILEVFRGLKYECDAEIEQKGTFPEGLILPWGGGAYFRMIPSPIFTMGVKSILKKKKAYLFYMHPWEIDAEQPRLNEAPAFCKFRQYVNLEKTISKFSSLIQTFKECRFITCHQYLEEILTANDVDTLRSCK
jgi:hypothetical protein